MKLGALPYHREVAGHLRTGEAALWSWFESDQFFQRYAEQGKAGAFEIHLPLDARRSAGRLRPCSTAAERLSLDSPVTVYQSHGGNGGANAALVFLPGEAALTLSGNIGDILDGGECGRNLATSCTTTISIRLDGGLYFTAARLLDWCAAQPGLRDSIHETGRLYRLHTEICADMGALHVTGNRDAVVSSLVKVSTGLKSVNPLYYLEQTEEIVEKRRGKSDGLAHPELHIRAKSVDILSSKSPTLNSLIDAGVRSAGCEAPRPAWPAPS